MKGVNHRLHIAGWVFGISRALLIIPSSFGGYCDVKECVCGNHFLWQRNEQIRNAVGWRGLRWRLREGLRQRNNSCNDALYPI